MFLALKELRHGKLRFMMIGVILVLISWLVFILSGLGNGLSTLSAASFKNMDADYVVFEEGSRNSMSRSTLPGELVEKLKNEKNVDAAAPMGVAMATLIKEDGKDDSDSKIDISLLAVEPGSFLEPETTEGKALSPDKPLEVIANDMLKDDGYKIGDTLVMEGTDKTLKIAGFTENQTYNHLPVVFLTMEKWRDINYAAPGSDHDLKDPVNAIMLQGSKIDPEVLNKAHENIETATKSQAVQGMPGYKEENGTIMMMLAFLLAISAFVLAVFFYVLTLQKTNQFGILKAIGASSSFLGKTIVSQVFVLSLVSIIIGILLTYGTALIFPEGMPFELDPVMVAVYSIVLLIICVLSSLLSVRKIAKIDPLKAIGRVE